jgi:hypothetical protein
VLKISAVLMNEGFLPTALEMAKRIKIVKPDLVEMKFKEEKIELLEGESRIELGFLGLTKKRRFTGRSE